MRPLSSPDPASSDQNMTRTLVVFYSWTGATATAAKAIARALSADVEEIREVKPRSGPLAHVRCVVESAFGLSPAIQPPQRSPAGYSAVVLGGPVWAQNIAGPVRAYARQTRAQSPAVIAGFCTCIGAGGEAALNKLSRACGKPLAARLILNEQDLQDGELDRRVRDFAAGVEGAPRA